MSENELYGLLSIEIDPDYESRIADEPDPKNQPARITTKKAWFMSLFLPVLSTLGCAVYVIMFPVISCLFMFTAIFGLIGGGIVPTVMIVRGKIDTSKHFLGKMILFVVLVVVVVFSWITSLNIWTWIAEGFHFLILPILMIIAELIFAAVQKTDLKTKICLALSSLAWGYLGFIIDFSCIFAAS